jgi:hypothetical protein
MENMKWWFRYVECLEEVSPDWGDRAFEACARALAITQYAIRLKQFLFETPF